MLTQGVSEEGWILFSKVGLKAGVGIGKFDLLNSSFYFPATLVTEVEAMKGAIHNPGNADTAYSFIIEDSQFIFNEEFALQGVIKGNETINFILTFKPLEAIYYSTEIKIITTAGNYVLEASGEGKNFKIDMSTIPKSINFGNINLGVFDYQKVQSF